MKDAKTIEILADGARWCRTRTGRAGFRVTGSIATGANIWPGKMLYPVKFPKPFMDAVLKRFKTGEFPVGGTFDNPVKGSLGEFIQQQLHLKLNPAVYLAALLINEGYAEETRRGYLKLVSGTKPEPEQPPVPPVVQQSAKPKINRPNGNLIVCLSCVKSK